MSCNSMPPGPNLRPPLWYCPWDKKHIGEDNGQPGFTVDRTHDFVDECRDELADVIHGVPQGHVITVSPHGVLATLESLREAQRLGQ